MRYLLASLLCVFTLSLTAQEACPNVFDFDNDGNVAVNDFIAMLSYFGDTDSDSDGVFDSEDDCIDETACNYQSNPSEICQYLDALGVCGGYCEVDDNGDGGCDPAVFSSCGDQIGHEGYNYSTVQIGEQCWFSENCRYLPSVSPANEGSTTDPYYYVYGYNGTDVEEAKSTTNYETSGVLYNWFAFMTESTCPSGWHIPSQEEFVQLGGFLGVDEGYAMKSTSGWDDWGDQNSGNGSNSSGFTALPGGKRGSWGNFSNSQFAFYVTSSPFGSIMFSWCMLTPESVSLGYSGNDYGHALSARCIRD